jgi:hypothetical protein
VSNTFTEGYGRPGEYQTGGHVIPVRIPDEAEMLRVAQRRYPETGALETDSRAIANAANVEAWKQRPTLLQSWLTKQHAMSPADVTRVADDLLAGRSVPIREGGDAATLMQHLQNYGSSVGADVHTVADLARKAWQDQGYKGLIYENTAPDEIRHALDRTSYIVFDPAHVRSRFAAFDPANIGRAGLMGSLAGLGVMYGGSDEAQASDYKTPQPTAAERARALAALKNQMAAENDPYEGDHYKAAMWNTMRADPRANPSR